MRNKNVLKNSLFMPCVTIKSHHYPNTRLYMAKSTSNIAHGPQLTSVDNIELTRPIIGYEEIIKKSRFVVFAASVKSMETAMSFIETHADPKASHNCWAIKLDVNTYRFSDDGEPSGTAGRPIYNAVDSSQYVQIVFMVTRYFGGIKLGAGGLIRAYQGVAKNALQSAIDEKNYLIQIPLITLQVIFPLHLTGMIYRLVDNAQGTLLLVSKISDDLQSIDIHLPQANLAMFQSAMKEQGKGLVKIKIVPADIAL